MFRETILMTTKKKLCLHTRTYIFPQWIYYKMKYYQWSHTRDLKHNSSLLLLTIVIVKIFFKMIQVRTVSSTINTFLPWLYSQNLSLQTHFMYKLVNWFAVQVSWMISIWYEILLKYMTFNHIPNFSNRWNLKQNFKKSNIWICEEKLSIQLCEMSSAST